MPNRSGIWSLRQAGVNEVNELWKDSYPNPRALFAGGRNRAGGVDHSNFIDSESTSPSYINCGRVL